MTHFAFVFFLVAIVRRLRFALRGMKIIGFFALLVVALSSMAPIQASAGRSSSGGIHERMTRVGRADSKSPNLEAVLTGSGTRPVRTLAGIGQHSHDSESAPTTASELIATKPGAEVAIGEKISGQMEPRGWTPKTIGETVANPVETHPVWDHTTGTKQAGTAYVRADGSYVVVNDATRTVVQVSDTTNPNWKPVWNDPRFKR